MGPRLRLQLRIRTRNLGSVLCGGRPAGAGVVHRTENAAGTGVVHRTKNAVAMDGGADGKGRASINVGNDSGMAFFVGVGPSLFDGLTCAGPAIKKYRRV